MSQPIICGLETGTFSYAMVPLMHATRYYRAEVHDMYAARIAIHKVIGRDLYAAGSDLTGHGLVDVNLMILIMKSPFTNIII